MRLGKRQCTADFKLSQSGKFRPFLVHSIRRVCCVVGKVETRQIAYVTKCEADDGKTSKECHIFRTSNRQQVDEIESVLSSTFQRIVFVDNPLPPLCSSDEASDTTISSGTARSNSLPEVPNPPPIQSSTSDSSGPESPVKKRQMSAAVFFQKFFGTPSRAAMKNVDLENLTDGTDPSTLTPIRSGKTAADRSRKRPVSAVFGQAMRHAASTLTPKKSSTLTYSSTPRPPTMKSGGYRNNLQEIHEHQPVASTRPAPKPEPVLQFDDNIGEFVFPIGEFMDDQLQRLAYFCRNPNRFEVYSALQQMPEGAFVLRYSESRRRCLALSVRVPDAVDTHGTRVAHYLIVRNEQGFRLHGSQRHFTSLPMLITHYTVLPELLPCRLIFVEWDKALLRGRTPVYHGRLVNLDDRSDYSTPIGLENLTALRSPMKKVPRRCSLDFSQL
uniref:SH2 domain-containing protein n=1 Tax=Panagrellus redivivus TaxID=6233 RepID=A0A7E4VHX1_PANRE